MLPTGAKPFEALDIGAPGARTLHKRRQAYYQKAPFDLPLLMSYQLGTYKVVPDGSPTVGSPPSEATAMPTTRFDVNLMNQMANKSYDRLRGDAYDTIGGGVNAVEYKQALGMMAKTAGTLLFALKQIKHLQFVGAAKTLKMHFVPKNVSARKSWSNNWLEYHFGWEPLCKDIYDAATVISDPLKTFSSVRGSSRISDTGKIVEINTFNTRTRVWYNQYTHRQGCIFYAPNNGALHTLEQYGILNPLELAWEVVPFSFVVDWFANVGQLLRAPSDFAGLTLKRTWSLSMYRYAEVGKVVSKAGGFYGMSFNGEGFNFNRSTSLTSPVFNIKKLTLPSVSRAATAVALLVQGLSKK